METEIFDSGRNLKLGKDEIVSNNYSEFVNKRLEEVTAILPFNKEKTAKEWVLAANLYGALLDYDPDSYDAKVGFGKALLKLHNRRGFEFLFDAIKQDPRKSSPYASLLRTYNETGQPENFLYDLEQAIAQYPSLNHLDIPLRNAFMSEDDFEGAGEIAGSRIEEFVNASKKPEISDLHIRGLSQIKIGDYKSAIANLTSIITRISEDKDESIYGKEYNTNTVFNSLANLGSAYACIKKLPESITYFEKALDIKFKPGVLGSMLFVMLSAGKEKEALEVVRKYEEELAHPNPADLAMGRTFLANNLPEDAKRVYERMRNQENPSGGERGLGAACSMLNEYKEALVHYQNVIDMGGLSHQLLNLIALTHNALGHGIRASWHIDNALEEKPDSPVYNLNKATIMLDRNKPYDALDTLLEKKEILQEENRMAYEILVADGLLSIGETESAKEHYEKGLTLAKANLSDDSMNTRHTALMGIRAEMMLNLSNRNLGYTAKDNSKFKSMVLDKGTVNQLEVDQYISRHKFFEKHYF